MELIYIYFCHFSRCPLSVATSHSHSLTHIQFVKLETHRSNSG
uniref:Uncharacterized protein n=1 Tax=Anguilla anguilla TaxID=7936 RepID=A0A0E9W760_ANGAN